MVAVVGDGALTGGLAFEGLNNAGQLQHRPDRHPQRQQDEHLAQRGGHLQVPDPHHQRQALHAAGSRHLGPAGQDARTGSKAQILAGRIKESLKQLVVPTILFEELGFKYFGPIDGHDLPPAGQAPSRRCASCKGPILIHLITEKGKGYRFAEQDGQRYHGVGKFDKAEGIKVVTPDVPSYTVGLRRDPGASWRRRTTAIHGITAAMPSGTGLTALRDALPEPLPRRGHRRGARRDLRRRPGLRRAATGGGHLFHLPAARPRPDHPRRGAAEAAGRLRGRPRRRGGRGRADPPRRLRPDLPAHGARHGGDGAARRGPAAPHAGHGPGPRGRAQRPCVTRAARAWAWRWTGRRGPCRWARPRPCATATDLCLLAVGSMVQPALEAADLLARPGSGGRSGGHALHQAAGRGRCWRTSGTGTAWS